MYITLVPFLLEIIGMWYAGYLGHITHDELIVMAM